MNKAFCTILFLFILTSAAYAADAVKSFTFQTIDGKTVEYKAARGVPMVINIGAYW